MWALTKRRRFLPGLTAIGMYPGAVCLLRVVREGLARPRVIAQDVRPLATGEAPDATLATLAREHQLKRAHCTTVLSGGDYKLVLTEVPEVAPDELKSAVRWRIKDLIDFHINDATLDVFDIPGQGGAGAAREVYVVAARSQTIQQRVGMLETAGVNLDIIDIPELAQRNIAALLPEDVHGVATLSFDDQGGLITLTRQGVLYLSRALATSARQLADASVQGAHFEQVVLEVQRSLDYYEGHFRLPPIAHVAIAPLPDDATAFVRFLGGNLNAKVRLIDLAELIDVEGESPLALQSGCLAALGAALRQEVKAL